MLICLRLQRNGRRDVSRADTETDQQISVQLDAWMRRDLVHSAMGDTKKKRAIGFKKKLVYKTPNFKNYND